MSLIATSYFENDDLNIPQNSFSTLSSYIEKYEKEYLLRVLGYDLYTLVAAYNASTSAQVIKDIVEGKSYSYDSNHTVNWEGLLRTSEPYDSPIAYYVYCHYVMFNHELLMPAGNAVPNKENATIASPNYKLAWMWNKMRRLTGYPGQDVLEPSLYNFLTFHISSYSASPYYWEWRDIGKMNLLGI